MESQNHKSQFRKIFGTDVCQIRKFALPALKEGSGRRFSFMGRQKFTALENGARNKVYWEELLARIYIASILTIARGDAWAVSVARAVSQGSYLSFASSSRALVESAADSHDALSKLPSFLTGNYDQIWRGLLEEKDEFMMSKELEDTLIHFTHARKLSKQEKQDAPKSHSAKFIRNYLDVLVNDYGLTTAAQFYDQMCDVTHPGYCSLSPWRSESKEHIYIQEDNSLGLIHVAMREHRQTLRFLGRLIYQQSLITLGIINFFELKRITSPSLREVSWSDNASWRKFMTAVGKSKYPITRHSGEVH